MKSTWSRILCRLLVVALVVLPFQARAGMIGTEEAAAAAATQADRTLVLDALARGDVARELQSQGVDPEQAKARVAAMTDAEAHALAGQIQSAPAGAHVSGWVIAVVVALAVWWWYAYR